MLKTLSKMSENPRNLSFFSHFDELRARLTTCLLTFFVMTCVAYGFSANFLALIVRPVGYLIFTAPSDAFIARMTLTFLLGFLLSSPIIFYHVWKFIAAGLKDHERSYIVLFGPLSLIFFAMGVLFAYFVMIPFALRFLLSFSTDFMLPMITVKNYISFVGTWVLAFGVVFELPLVLMFLAKIGIATPEFLRQYRRHAIVLILIVSAILTPPDVVSQLLMAVPLMVLYEIGIVMVAYTSKNRVF